MTATGSTSAGGRVADYRQQLAGLADIEAFLLKESRLPGARGNLELAQAFALEAPQDLIVTYAGRTEADAPGNTPQGFVAFCGVLGLGRLAAEGDQAALDQLTLRASDRRWRIREAAAMALQMVGRSDSNRLRRAVIHLALGDRYQQRAAVAALCEPDLLGDPELAGYALDVLDTLTAGLAGADDRRSPGWQALRKTLGYGWSVLIVAAPAEGRRRFSAWLDRPDPDVRWLLRENLRKARLARFDPNWVAACQQRLEQGAPS